jgi:hypothetical protein
MDSKVDNDDDNASSDDDDDDGGDDTDDHVEAVGAGIAQLFRVDSPASALL